MKINKKENTEKLIFQFFVVKILIAKWTAGKGGRSEDEFSFATKRLSHSWRTAGFKFAAWLELTNSLNKLSGIEDDVVRKLAQAKEKLFK